MKKFTYIWEYLVNSDFSTEFETAYHPEGTWVKLFQQANGYIRTELHHDRADPVRYVTIDYWESQKSHKKFREQFTEQFLELDRFCEKFTKSERFLGNFNLFGG